MKKSIITMLVTMVTCFVASAQQDPSFSMYMFNGLFINPAYAGSQEAISMMAIYRQQWVGVDGAPRTADVSVNGPFRQEQYAMGLDISNDMYGKSNTFNVTPSFAYRLRIKKSHLCFGVQASLGYFYQNSQAIPLSTDATDLPFQWNQKLFVPNFGFGIYAYGARYFVGISVPHLLPDQLRGATGVVGYNADIAHLYNYYLLTAGYVFGKDASIVKVRPSVLLKYQQGLPNNIPQCDIDLAVLFLERLWIGVGYRTGGGQVYYGQSAMIFAQFKVTPQLQIGYSYDADLTAISHFTTGTHEIMLGYDFWYDKKRFVSPRYVKYF